MVLLAALALWFPARTAQGQACCASAGLVAPTRLRGYEDFAVGLQGKGRTIFGAFNPSGGYAGSTAGDSEWDLEQDLFGVARVFGRGQVALLIPTVETRAVLAGIQDAGGGIGDVAASARYDFIDAGEHNLVPGLAVLLGVVFPTGTPPENAGGPASTTGQGSFEGSAGVGIEQAFGSFFATIQALVSLRSSRHVANVNETFGPRLTTLVAGGRMLPHGATLGVFASGMRQGENSDDRGPITGSDVSLLTLGLASTISPSDNWRVQGTLFGNVPAGGAGRNQTAGAGVTVSLIRVWL